MSQLHNSNLYQWKRFTRRKDEEKFHQEKEKAKQNMFDDEWVRQKLEMASENALKVALKSSPDDNYEEANELLNEWVGAKLHDEFLTDDTDTMLMQKVKNNNSTNTWYNDTDAFMEHCLKVTDFGNLADSSHASVPKKPQDDIDLECLYKMDNGDAASFITKRLLEKPIVTLEAVKKAKKNTTKIKSDPATLMEMRHKAVKETMEKRREAEKKKQEEKLRQQEAKRKAKELLKREEQKRLLKIKQEEDAIKKEMIRFRKEFALQKQREQLSRKCDKEKFDNEIKNVLKFERDISVVSETTRNENHIIAKQKQDMNVSLFMIKCRKKILQNYFSEWYKSVLISRMKMGKAKAMGDWRILFKSWNAWKKYVQEKKSEEAAVKHVNEIKMIKKSEKIAEDSNRIRLLKKYFLYWKLWTKTELEKRNIEEQKQFTKMKMKALIEKVVHAKEEKNPDDIIIESVDIEDKHNTKRNQKEIEALFASKTPNLSARNKIPLRKHKPKAAWQVTKDHLILSPQDMRNLGGNATPLSGAENIPNKKHFDPYKNRQKFQKEMLDEQKHLIQEQKRMIEELKEERKLLALNKEIAGFKNTKNDKHQRYFIDENSQIDSKFSSRENTVPTQAITKSKKIHPIVSAMELRAQERAKRHEELVGKKRKKEQEKMEELQRIELERIKEVEEKQRLEKEEKRKEKERKLKMEQDKKLQIEKMKKLNQIAVDHYKRSLVKNYGIKPLKRLVASAKAKYEVAECHYNDALLKNTFVAWKIETNKSIENSKLIAESAYRIMLLKRVMSHWKAYGKHMEILEQKANMFCNRHLKAKYIQYWAKFATNEKLREWDNEAKAKDHDLSRRKKRVFTIFSTHARNVREAKQKQETISMLRQHVTRLLPDYNPDLSESFTNDT